MRFSSRFAAVIGISTQVLIASVWAVPAVGVSPSSVQTAEADGTTTFWAVIVGVSDYVGSASDLDYCDDDARDIRTALLEDGDHWSSSRIQLILDSAATRSAVQTAIQTVATQADDDDLFIFYFSGHGGYGADQPPYDEADGKDECIYPHALDAIWDDELAGWIGAVACDKVFIMLDTCHSGGMFNPTAAGSDRPKVKGLGPPRSEHADGFAEDLVHRVGLRDVNDTIATVVVLTACRANELAQESSFLRHGVFTYFVLQGLDGDADAVGNDNGWTSSQETYTFCYPLVVAYAGHHPQLYQGYAGQLEYLCHVQAPPLPSAPSNLTAMLNGSNQGELGWTDNSGNEDGFTVQRRMRNPDGSWPAWTTLAWLGPNTTTYTDTTISLQGYYQYRVRAYNAAGPSAWSDTAALWLLTSPPQPPIGLQGQLVSGSRVDLTWTNTATNAYGCLLQRRKQAGDGSWPDFTSLAWLEPPAEQYSDTALSGDGLYQYRVRAYNYLGPSAYADPVKVLVTVSVPAKPTDLQAQRVPVSPSGKDDPVRDNVQLTWTDNANNEATYVVQRRRRNNDGSWPTSWDTLTLLSHNSETYLDEALPSDGHYQYRVRAQNYVGPSSWSDPAKLWVCTSVPAAPTDVTASSFPSARVRLSWTDNADNNEGYLIQRRQQNANGTWPDWSNLVWLSREPHAESYTDAAVTVGATYQYRVRAYNYLGPSNWGPYAQITVSLSPTAELAAVSVRQVNGQCVSVVYSLTAAADVVLQVRNIAGRLVVEVPCGEACAGLNTATWNLRNGAGALVPAGTYLCTLTARSPEGSQASTIRSVQVRR